jgi:hypothetical protein
VFQYGVIDHPVYLHPVLRIVRPQQHNERDSLQSVTFAVGEPQYRAVRVFYGPEDSSDYAHDRQNKASDSGEQQRVRQCRFGCRYNCGECRRVFALRLF